MRVVALGHAGLRLETTSSAILVDPWFAPGGAFLSAWFPFPDNEELVCDAFDGVSAVILTHEHQDHFDPWVLRTLPDSVPVFIPSYPSRRFASLVARSGHEVVEVPASTSMRTGSFTLHCVLENSPMNHDSAVAIEADGTSIANLNDARLTPLQLRSVRDMLGGQVDILFVQCAGASWFPLCYDYSIGTRDKLVQRKRAARLQYGASAAKVLDATVVVPYAGPPCFLDAQLANTNDQLLGGMFPQHSEAAAFLTTAGVRGVHTMQPGDVWERGMRSTIASDSLTRTELYSYIDRYRERREPYIAYARAMMPLPERDLDTAVRAYFTELVEMNAYFSGQIGLRVAFDVTGPHGGQWTVDFNQRDSPVSDGKHNWQYAMRFESRWLAAILRGELFWEDLLLSMRVELHRTPDRYNDYLLGLLKFADVDALSAVERYETQAPDYAWTPITSSSGQVRYIERTCPHAGNDLAEFASLDLEAGTIRCLGHNYEFDIESGMCTNATCRPLRTKRAR